MGTQGEVKNVAITPSLNKNDDSLEVIFPAHIELRNGRMSTMKNWIKRPGYAQRWDTGASQNVMALIPEDSGYAITRNSTVYNLSAAIPSAMGSIFTSPTAPQRPTWSVHNETLVIANGGRPSKIEEGTLEVLGGSPPKARFVDTISNYTVMSGYKDAEGEYTEFSWSASGNPEQWDRGALTDAGFSSVKKDGDIIRNMIVLREAIYLFKDRSIEPWSVVGGSLVFARSDSRIIDTGLGADYSAIKANNTLYWLGDDYSIYQLQGGAPVKISHHIDAEIRKLTSPELVYALHFRADNTIRWFAPVEGKCFAWDYLHNVWSEDNEWKNGQFVRFPINSYMELDGSQYVGDYDPTGKVFEWSNEHKDDDGKPIRVQRKLAIKPSLGQKVKFNRIDFRVKRGVEPPSTSNPQLIYRYNLDKGDFKNYEHLDLGEHGDRNPWIRRVGLGSGREMELEIIETDATKYVLTDINLTMRLLG
jgi:hypothetical protein